MEIKKIAGATRTLGATQGYQGLPIRDTKINCSVDGQGTPCMESEWTPTTSELARLAAGGSIKLSVIGTTHPPVMLVVDPIKGEGCCDAA